MLLAIDAGNTNITFAVFDNEEIVTTFRLTTETPRTSDEFGVVIESIISNKKVDINKIDAAIIATVVPDVMHALINSIIKYLGFKPMIVGPGMKTGIRLIKTDPKEVGPDRIVDGVAALELYGGPVIVCDYGTATKFDFFSEGGAFEAAVTCPGIMISARALWGGTARLPEIEIRDPGTIMAKDTIKSLQAGIMYGHIGEAEYIIDRLIKESGAKDVKVVATGGFSNIIFPSTDKIQYHEPNLTMIGLRLLYEKNR